MSDENSGERMSIENFDRSLDALLAEEKERIDKRDMNEAISNASLLLLMEDQVALAIFEVHMAYLRKVITYQLKEPNGSPMEPEKQARILGSWEGQSDDARHVYRLEAHAAMTTGPAKILAAYALNLAHGAELEDFERDHLIQVAAIAGLCKTEAHDMLARRREMKDKKRELDIEQLKAQIAAMSQIIASRPRWWQVWRR